MVKMLRVISKSHIKKELAIANENKKNERRTFMFLCVYTAVQHSCERVCDSFEYVKRIDYQSFDAYFRFFISFFLH